MAELDDAWVLVHEKKLASMTELLPLLELVAKSGKRFRDLLVEICELVKGPVSAEVVAQDMAGMMREAHDLSGIAPNIVVKIPLTAEGLKAVKACSDEYPGALASEGPPSVVSITACTPASLPTTANRRTMPKATSAPLS